MTKLMSVMALAASLVAGASLPAFAQAGADFSGVWQPRYHEDQPDRIPGPELTDYTGLPINDSARQYANSWDPSRLTLPEEQCRVHVSPYIYRGPLNLRIWEEKDPKTQDLIAIKHYSSTFEQTRTIWMDGRPRPGPNAAHTWMGFSTGRYDGDMLIVETTPEFDAGVAAVETDQLDCGEPTPGADEPRRGDDAQEIVRSCRPKR